MFTRAEMSHIYTNFFDKHIKSNFSPSVRVDVLIAFTVGLSSEEVRTSICPHPS